MVLSEITQFRLLFSEISSYEDNPNYTIKSVDLSKINQYKPQIETIITYHHEDLIWDGIPSYNDVLERLQFGSKLNLWYKNGEPVGWNWYNTRYVTLNWKNAFQELRENELYCGSAFLTKKARKPISPASLFYTMGMEKMLLDENKNTIYLYVDNWNIASLKLCLRAGMKKFDFINQD